MSDTNQQKIYEIPFERNIYFSPAKVLRDYFALSTEEKAQYEPENRKVIEEAFQSATWISGIMKLHQREYWMQLVDPQERTPDIRTIVLEKREGKSDWMYEQDLEVTEYEDHSEESIAEFLIRTKLSPKKAYSPLASILCFMNKTMPTPDWELVNKQLREMKSSLDVYIVAQVSADEPIFRLIRVNPVLDMDITFNAVDAAKEWSNVHTRKFRRGTKEEEKVLPDERHYPFWKIR